LACAANWNVVAALEIESGVPSFASTRPAPRRSMIEPPTV
jgi:hypothetical protein